MSATHAPADAAAPAADEPAIVTEFRERLLARYPECDDVSAALRKAEQAASSTAREEMGTCPVCGSVRLRQKPGGEQPHKRRGEIVCTQCRSHLSPPGGVSFGDGVEPRYPSEPVVVVPMAGRFHHAEGCSFNGGTTVEATAGELVTAGVEVAAGHPTVSVTQALAPCQCEPCQAAGVEPEPCTACGDPTFGAVEGISEAVCADCTEVSEDE